MDAATQIHGIQCVFGYSRRLLRTVPSRRASRAGSRVVSDEIPEFSTSVFSLYEARTPTWNNNERACIDVSNNDFARSTYVSFPIFLFFLFFHCVFHRTLFRLPRTPRAVYDSHYGAYVYVGGRGRGGDVHIVEVRPANVFLFVRLLPFTFGGRHDIPNGRSIFISIFFPRLQRCSNTSGSSHAP